MRGEAKSFGRSSIDSIWCITVWAARRLFVSEVILASNFLVRFDTFAVTLLPRATQCGSGPIVQLAT